jgi:hypothetical protein
MRYPEYNSQSCINNCRPRRRLTKWYTRRHFVGQVFVEMLGPMSFWPELDIALVDLDDAVTE